MVDNSHILSLNADVALDELADNAVAVGLPMNTTFRNTTLREVMLIKGPVGWAEFSPFPEYGPAESARWLSATIEAGWHGWPEPIRDTVPVNATVPAVAPDDVERVLARFGPVEAVKVKVAEDDLATDIAPGEPVRCRRPGPHPRIAPGAKSQHHAARAHVTARPVAAGADPPDARAH